MTYLVGCVSRYGTKWKEMLKNHTNYFDKSRTKQSLHKKYYQLQKDPELISSYQKLASLLPK